MSKDQEKQARRVVEVPEEEFEEAGRVTAEAYAQSRAEKVWESRSS